MSNQKPIKKLLIKGLFFIILGLGPLLFWVCPAQAQTPAPGNPVYIYLFWGDGCPHCAKAKPYLESLAATYPEVILKSYEVYYNEDNQKLFVLMAEKYGIEQLAVPTIIIGPYYLLGYSEGINADIESTVSQCIRDGCIDPSSLLVDVTTSTPNTIIETQTPTNPATSTQNTIFETLAPTNSASSSKEASKGISQSNELAIPLLGTIDLDSKSTILSTALIALVDGFNPCSLWVLTMLLALTLHTGSRKKVILIGGVFLTITAGIYALFIIGLFSVLKIAGFMGWIRILVALIALFFAIVNIKDYFWYKEGISLTIPESKKPGIYKKLRMVMDSSNSLGSLVGATIVLAAGVSLVEFSCTAGFPVIWTNILTTQNVNGVAFILLLIIYMLIYQLDEMIIFFSSVRTLKASRIEEKHGRILKLISGMLMLTLSVVMLLNPSLLNNLYSSLAIFGIAFISTLAIFLLHRYLLPILGIYIGTNF